MRVVQMTLEENLINTVDKIAKQLGTSRSSFTRNALSEAVKSFHIKKLIEKHKQGYMKKPVKKGEFDIWEKEQVWGD